MTQPTHVKTSSCAMCGAIHNESSSTERSIPVIAAAFLSITNKHRTCDISNHSEKYNENRNDVGREYVRASPAWGKSESA